MTWKPHVTVAAIIEQDQKFLLVEEIIDGQKVLNQPAGHLEDGESIIAATIRETLEETARHFTPEYLVGLYRWKMPAKDRTYIRYCFNGQASETIENMPLDTDILRTVWLSYDEIIKQKNALRSPLVLACVDDYRNGERYPLTMLKEIENA